MRYREHRPLIYVETWNASVFLEKRRDVDDYRALVDRISQVALDPMPSRDLIARLASEYELMGDSGHDLAQEQLQRR